MKNLVNITVCLMLVMLLSTAVTASDCGLAARWKFENLNEEKVIRSFEEEEEEEDEDEEDEEREELEQELEEVELEIELLKEEMEELQEKIEQASGSQKAELQEGMEALEREMEGLRGEMEELEEEMEEEEEEFEEVIIRTVHDDIGDIEDHASGAYLKIVPGVSGNAIQLDGYTSYIVREAENAPIVSGDFSVEAWIALGAYPTHWCPIADHSSESEKGYFLGIDAKGHAGFKLTAGGERYELQSDERIPLRKWTHIAGVYCPEDGMALYLDGKKVESKKVDGKFKPATCADLLIGRHSIKRKPDGTIRPNATEAVHTFYDGLIDELSIYDRALSADDISKYVADTKPSAKPALSQRKLPAGPEGPGKFGAFYTTLKYYDAWDAPWRIGQHADVVVRFDESPCRFVFWRGTSYIPHWVTENGIWYDNEFNETWSELGCHEPMSDKRCHHSHVRIIENTDARVVVHWRYALVDNWYNLAKVDELTGWGDWTDEVYTVYPDMIGIRKVTLHSSQPTSPHEWHEGIIVMGPGQRPEQVLHPDALTLANMEGETHVYSWEHGAPGEDGLANEPEGANIHWVNTKSKYKPIVIVSPDSGPEFDIYAGELRRDVSMFPWWNHWPTAQKPCDGRYAMDSDLASHSSLSHCSWKAYAQTENSMTKIMINGLTDKSAKEQLSLAKSWATPAELKVKGNGFCSDGYDPTQRAYVLNCKSKGSVLNIELAASEEQPIFNPAFVINGWGPSDAELKINGKEIKRGKDFRFGHRHGLEGSDLIVWIKKESVKPTEFTVLSLSN